MQLSLEFNNKASEGNPSLENILRTFIFKIRAKFNKDEFRLDNNETHMTDMKTTMKNLEVRICELVAAITFQQKGKFLSNIEINLKEHCNAIALRSEKELEESKPTKLWFLYLLQIMKRRKNEESAIKNNY